MAQHANALTDRFILQNYGRMTAPQIAAELGWRDPTKVRVRAQRLGVANKRPGAPRRTKPSPQQIKREAGPSAVLTRAQRFGLSLARPTAAKRRTPQRYLAIASPAQVAAKAAAQAVHQAERQRTQMARYAADEHRHYASGVTCPGCGRPGEPVWCAEHKRVLVREGVA